MVAMLLRIMQRKLTGSLAGIPSFPFVSPFLDYGSLIYLLDSVSKHCHPFCLHISFLSDHQTQFKHHPLCVALSDSSSAHDSWVQLGDPPSMKSSYTLL